MIAARNSSDAIMMQVAPRGSQKHMERWVGALIGASDIRLCGALEKGSARRTILADSARVGAPLSYAGQKWKGADRLRSEARVSIRESEPGCCLVTVCRKQET